MADSLPGASAPVVNAPAADAVPALDAPVVENAEPSQAKEPVQPRTYTEEENRKIVSDRLKKESRRIERAVRAELERDFYKQQLESRSQPQQDQPKGKPDPKDYQDWDTYQDALVDWKIEQRSAEHGKKQQQDSQSQQQHREMAERAKHIRETVVAQGIKKYSDFEEVAFGDVAITQPMAAAIARLPAGHDVWYHLGQNPDEAMRIANLPDIEQVWEIKSLESKLSAPPKPTQAPPPIVPGSANAGVQKDYSQMTTAEHVEAYRNRKKR